MELGVIIGRFQIHELHEGHKALIDHVKSKHKQVLIMLGVSPTLNTKKNPLDYLTREKMIKSVYPEIAVIPLSDMASDSDWSNQIDSYCKLANPIGRATLYGGRDSFIPHYSGQNKTTTVDLEQSDSGTSVRQEVANEILVSSDFRAGIIYAAYNQYPKVHPTVDIAALDLENKHILLGRKLNEILFRFPGGFVDQNETLENAASRELKEETNIKVFPWELKYEGSFVIDDWRYKSSLDGKIISSLFSAQFKFRATKDAFAGDDLAVIDWFPLNEETQEKVNPAHKDMYNCLLNKYGDSK